MDFVRGVFDFIPGRSGDGSQTTSLETPGAYVARQTRLVLAASEFRSRRNSLPRQGPDPVPVDGIGTSSLTRVITDESKASFGGIDSFVERHIALVGALHTFPGPALSEAKFVHAVEQNRMRFGFSENLPIHFQFGSVFAQK